MLSAVGSFGKTSFVDRISVYEFLIYDNKRSIRNCSSNFYVGVCNTVSSTNTYLEPVFLGTEVDTHFVNIVR